MSDEKKESVRDVMSKQKKLIEAIALGLMLVGAFIAVWGVVYSLPMAADLMDDDHISTPDMPYKDRANVTYTWTQKELFDLTDRGLPFLLVGLAFIFAGWVTMLATVSDKKFHKTCCKGEGEAKYCSECGYKLSRLEQ